MPQLPPVAAAAVVLCLLAAVTITTMIVQMRSRRRRLALAAMVRESAPIPRPTVSTVDMPLEPELQPLRGRSYARAEHEARFRPFDDRPATREGAPGRPGRRLAAQVAYAAPVATPPPPSLPVPILEVAPEVALPAPAAGPSVPSGLLGAPGAEMLAVPAQEVTPDVAVQQPLSPEPVPLAAGEEAALEAGIAVPPVADSTGFEVASRTHGGLESVFALDVSDSRSAGVPTSSADSPASAPPLASTEPIAEVPEPLGAAASAEAEPAQPPRVDGVVAQAPVEAGDQRPAVGDGPGVTPARDESSPPRHADEPGATRARQTPEVVVLAPRPSLPVPALSPLLSREVSLGDAARVLRGLTMTDGRQLRRAVAVGAATSVVAAAFALRARRRSP